MEMALITLASAALVDPARSRSPPPPPRCRAHLSRATTFAIAASPSRHCPAVASAVIVGRYLRVVVRGGTQRRSRDGMAASASLFRNGTRPDAAVFASMTVAGRGCPPPSLAAGRRPPPSSSASSRYLRVVVRGGTRRPSREAVAAHVASGADERDATGHGGLCLHDRSGARVSACLVRGRTTASLRHPRQTRLWPKRRPGRTRSWRRTWRLGQTRPWRRTWRPGRTRP